MGTLGRILQRMWAAMTNGSERARELTAVSPEMQAAWVAYDPPTPISAEMNIPKIIGAIRYAFYAGWTAALAQGREEAEREIVEWLRELKGKRGSAVINAQAFANMIERREHRSKGEPK